MFKNYQIEQKSITVLTAAYACSALGIKEFAETVIASTGFSTKNPRFVKKQGFERNYTSNNYLARFFKPLSANSSAL